MSPDEIIQLSQLSRLSGISHEVQKIQFKKMFDADQDCLVGEVAAELGMSTRSLQRALSAEGSTFAQLQNEIKRYKSIYVMVTKPELDIKSLSEIVGFKDRTSFTNAVRNWFGCSPKTLKVVLKGVSLKRGVPPKLASVDIRLLDNARNGLKELHAQLKKFGIAKEVLAESKEIQKLMTKYNKSLRQFRM